MIQKEFIIRRNSIYNPEAEVPFLLADNWRAVILIILWKQ